MWSSSGFTLLELMMVLLLIGLLIGAGLTLDVAGAPDSPQAVAAQVAEQVRLATLEAVQGGERWGLDFFRDGRDDGYRWLRQKDGAWQLADAAVLDMRAPAFTLPSALGWQLSLDGSVVQPEPPQPLQLQNGVANPRFRPDIQLLPTREVTPFVLQLCTQAPVACSTQVTVDALGRVEVVDAPR